MTEFDVFYGDYAPDMQLADLHVHTRRSDGWWAPERLAEAAVARGLSAVGTTDHDDIAAGYAVADYCARRNLPLRVYPGAEISARAGGHDVHVLGFDLSAEIAPWQSVEATVEAILRQGGFVVMPHPKAPGRGHPTFDQVLDLGEPVAVEVYNASVTDLARIARARGLKDANAEALAFYEAHRESAGRRRRRHRRPFPHGRPGHDRLPGGSARGPGGRGNGRARPPRAGAALPLGPGRLRRRLAPPRPPPHRPLWATARGRGAFPRVNALALR